MSRLSTVAVSTFTPALNVLSTTLPDSTCLSLVRTNAGPLPGFTCWNSTTDHSWPSRFSTRPFFRSLVLATERSSPALYDKELLGGQRQKFGNIVPHDERVLDANTAPAGQVHARFNGDCHAGRKSTFARLGQRGRLVDLQPDAVSQPVQELLAVPGVLD